MTPCKHIFHGGCLKKWLFVQDHCPMCAAKISEQELSKETQEQPAGHIEDVQENDWNVIQQNVVNQPEEDVNFENIIENTLLEGD